MITIKPSNSLGKYQKVWKAFLLFNKDKNPYLNKISAYKGRNLNLYAYDGKEIVGGLMGYIKFNWLYIDVLHVDERMRGQDIGSSLIAEAEKFVKENKLTGMYVNTFDFQAKPFYEKCGFEACGCIENMPPESKMWILKKEIINV